MARDFRTKKSLDETTKTLWHNILFFSGCECFVTTYNEQGLVTSYEVDDFVFVFKYNEQQQLTEWTATISDQIPCIYSFLYNEKGLLYKITEKIPTGIFKEYLYDEKGDMVAVVEDGYIDEYQYSYNSKGELVRLKHYLNEKVQNEDLLLYDERGNKTLFCSFREENEEDEDEDRRKVFINSYKNGHLAKQEILYYENGNKEFLFFDEQGNIIEKQYFEIKPYQGFELLYTVFYKYFDGKVERTQINEDFKEVIVCKDIVHEEDPLCNKRRYDRHRYNLFIDKLFSYALYDKNSDEMERFVRTYLTNGEMGTVFYRNGTPEYIVRKECTIVEN